MSSDTKPNTASADGEGEIRNPAFAMHPPLPLEIPPVFVWPIRPLAALKWLASQHYPFVIALSVFAFYYLSPSLEQSKEFAVGWVAQIFFVNLAILVAVAGGLHLYLYTFRKQGDDDQYDTRPFPTDSKLFWGKNQVWDNVFYSCVSGVTIWTAYQSLFMWLYANDKLPWTDFASNPVWFVVVFLILIVWEPFHFYWMHRWMHWKPLYKISHIVHHRNSNVGPWSGISMNPVEHVIYFSGVLIHFVIASHPIHMIYQMYENVLGAVVGHAGFKTLKVNGKTVANMGDFHHQLHHRYFDCNYGVVFMPFDKWFDSYHDGTPESLQRLRRKQKK